jgi:hypothetical protein
LIDISHSLTVIVGAGAVAIKKRKSEHAVYKKKQHTSNIAIDCPG